MLSCASGDKTPINERIAREYADVFEENEQLRERIAKLKGALELAKAARNFWAASFAHDPIDEELDSCPICQFDKAIVEVME